MGSFGGLILTNKGRALQAKVQAGTTLQYTRIALGDGNLNGQSISDLSGMISEKKSLDITKLKQLGDGKVTVGAYLTNQGLATGFYFRELGVLAMDPDLGEILYCYGNAGSNAEYIPAGGGPDIVEKNIDLVTIVGNAANVTATIDQSLVYITQQDFDAHKNANILDHPDGSVTTVKLADGAVTPVKLSFDPATQVELDGKFDPTTGHKHTGVAGDGPQIGTSGIANDAITNAKMANNSVGTAELIAGAATDTIIGNRTISDATAPTGDSGTPTTLFGWLAYMLKSITGGATWRTLPGMTIAAIKTILDAATNAATASVIMKRDVNGRAQVADPSAAQDIVNLQTMQALDNKDAVRAATTANITLSGTQTVDGVVLAVGDRVLVKNQTTGSQNGLYVVASGSWTRATDADTAAKVSYGLEVRVMEGTINALTGWQMTTTGAITIGTTSLTFTQVEGNPDGSTLEYSNGKLQAKDGGITDAKIGNRTADPNTATAYGLTGTITQFLSWILKYFKSITGKANPFDAPAITLEATNTHVNATTGIHGATSAATANALAQRDANGRLQVADPQAAQDVATKAYVDAVEQGLDIKDSVRVATTANITLSGTQTIDGVTLIVGDRVLVKNQTTGSQNGIYLVASGAWTRTTDADTSAKVTSGMYVFVSEGSTQADSGWVLTTNDPITLGTTTLVFTQFSGAGQITAGNALTKTGNQLDVAVDNTGIEVSADALRLKDGGVTDAKIGNRTADPNTATAYGLTGTITQLFSWVFKYLKSITGKPNPFDTPSINLETVSGYLNQDVKTTASPTFAGLTLNGTSYVRDTNNLIDKNSSGLFVRSLDLGARIEGKTTARLASNCYHDGTNWNRMDTAQAALLVDANSLGGVFQIYLAPAGANPIVWQGPYEVRNENSYNSITFVQASKNAIQNISANTFTKVVIESEIVDVLGEWSNNRCTVQKPGRYLVTGKLGFTNYTDQQYIDVAVVTNGVTAQGYHRLATSGTISGQSVTIAEEISLGAGDFIELFVFSNSTFTIENYSDRNNIKIQRIA